MSMLTMEAEAISLCVICMTACFTTGPATLLACGVVCAAVCAAPVP